MNVVRNQLRNKSTKAFLLVSMVVLGAQVARADQYPKQPVPSDRNNFASKNNPLLDANTLREAVALPDVPPYTGKLRFLFGSVHQAKQGPNYVMKFKAKEDSKEVIEWYRSTLQTYKWKLTASNAQAVQATNKDGNTISVIASDMGAKKDGERTQLEINYFQQDH